MNSFNSRIRGFNSPCVQYGGCPIQDGDGICGEPNSLQISREFKKMYEDKMAIIEGEGGDCLQEKLKLQQDWINDLTQQNEMLISVVQELEYEATEKVQKLEEKLEQSQQCVCDAQRKLNDSDRTIQELQQKVNHYSSFGDVESMARQLRCKNDECESLRQDIKFHIDSEQFMVLTYSENKKKRKLSKKMCQNQRQIYSEPSTDNSWTFTDEKTGSKKIDLSNEKFISSTNFVQPKTMDLKKKVEKLWPEKDEKVEQHKPQLHPIAQASNSVIKASQSVINATNSITNQTSATSTEQNVLICGGAKPCLIINHSTKRQTGRNTVIFINQDGSVQKHLNYCLTKTEVEPKLEPKQHSSACSKCRNKLDKLNQTYPKTGKNNDRFIFPACKSENDLLKYKNMLRPVKERSNLTNSTLGALTRCKTFVDKPYKTDLDSSERTVSVPTHMPVKLYVNNLELNKNISN